VRADAAVLLKQLDFPVCSLFINRKNCFCMPYDEILPASNYFLNLTIEELPNDDFFCHCMKSFEHPPCSLSLSFREK